MVQLKRKVTLKEKHEVVDTTEKIPSEPQTQKESSNEYSCVSEKKSKSWLSFLLCGLLIVGAGIYILTRDYKEDEKIYTSNVVKEETPKIKNEDVVIPVSEGQQIPVVDTTLIVDDKGIIPNEVVTVVENKNVNSIIEKKRTFPESSAEVSKSESVVRSVSVPVSEIERTAKDVIRGKYGNGRIRKDKLGDQYSEIQSRVNEMYRKRSQ